MTNKILFIVCGVTFAVPCLVFAQFTVRLVYRWLTLADAANGSVWTVVWAIFFPAMTIICGWISWYFFRSARRKAKVWTFNIYEREISGN